MSDVLVEAKAAKIAVRRSARLVILDPCRRMLLFRYCDEHQPPFWSTVGGELRQGEDYRTAARRELAEETGFDASIGAVIREREAVFAVARSEPARWLERYFLVECPWAQAPSAEGWSAEERETIQNWRWWHLWEMRAGSHRFLPEWLPDVLEASIGLSGDDGTRKDPG